MRYAWRAHLVLLGVMIMGGLLPVHAQERATTVPVPVLGRTLDVRMGDEDRYTGELIEVADDTLLMLGGEGLLTLPLREITSVRFERHGFGSSDAWLWVGIGAAATGLGMTAACLQIEDTSCSGVFLGASITWGLVGGLLAGSVAAKQYDDLDPTPPHLRPYARFPQGAPEGFRDRVSGGGAGSR